MYKDESTDTERVTLLGTVQYLLNIMMYSIKIYILASTTNYLFHLKRYLIVLRMIN